MIIVIKDLSFGEIVIQLEDARALAAAIQYQQPQEKLYTVFQKLILSTLAHLNFASKEGHVITTITTSLKEDY